MEISFKMSEICNINAHYTNNPKVQRPKVKVANTPNNIPNTNCYEPDFAKKRLEKANKELNIKHKKEEKKEFHNFLKGTAVVAISILALLGLKKLFKKF